MSAIIQFPMCYFCDELFPRFMMNNHNELWICDCCENFILPIDYDNQENGCCCVCCENKPLIKLPTCIHRLCFYCCKTIYFGYAINERPTHWREMTIESS